MMEDPPMSEETRASVMKGLRESAEGKTRYKGSFARYAKEGKMDREEYQQILDDLGSCNNIECGSCKRNNEKLLAEFDRLTEKLYEAERAVAIKAEALDRICKPIREGHKEWGITDHKKLNRICNYLDSQQKPLNYCSKCGMPEVAEIDQFQSVCNCEKPKDEEVLRGILKDYITEDCARPHLGVIENVLVKPLIWDILEHFTHKEGE